MTPFRFHEPVHGAAEAPAPRPVTRVGTRNAAWAAAWMAALFLAMGLSGCSVMRVDNQVESHAIWPPGALPTGIVSYRFERLPSQQSPLQTELEGWVASALKPQGWQATGADEAPWRVAVSASHTVLPRAPWESPPDRWRLGLGLEGGSRGRLNLGLLASADMPYHLRVVSVVVRDGTRGQVVYETQARHDGRWNDSPALWQAMVQAALSGFPTPTAGTRQIDIDIPR